MPDKKEWRVRVDLHQALLHDNSAMLAAVLEQLRYDHLLRKEDAPGLYSYVVSNADMAERSLQRWRSFGVTAVAVHEPVR